MEEALQSAPGGAGTAPAGPLSDGASGDVSRFGGACVDEQGVDEHGVDERGANERGNWSSRLVWFVLFAVPLAVVITAAMLTPAAAGHGTHTQLGLPPCGFLVFTGYPCPGCGLTTAFAHMVRLQVFGAWRSNPFGIVLFLCTAATIPVAAAGFVRGWGVVATLDKLHAEKIAIGLSLLSLTVWIIRVAAQTIAG